MLFGSLEYNVNKTLIIFFLSLFLLLADGLLILSIYYIQEVSVHSMQSYIYRK